MSVWFAVDLVIPLIPSEDMISNIVTNVKRLEPVSFSHWIKSTGKYETIDIDTAASVAWAELNNRRYSSFIMSLPCEEPDCYGRLWDDSLGWEHAEPATLNFYREQEALTVSFAPEGASRFGRDYGIGVDFQWYVSKLLAITRPYPLAKLIAQCSYRDPIIPTEWKVEALLGMLYWSRAEYPVAERDKEDLENMAAFFVSLEKNLLSSGSKLINCSLGEFLKTEPPIVLPIKTSWGMANVIMNECKLSVAPLTQEDNQLDLRPYLQILSDLMEGWEAKYVEAFNGIGYQQTTDSSLC